MEAFTEDDYLHARDTAISKALPPAERRHKAQIASRAERAARRADRDGFPPPAAEGTRRLSPTPDRDILRRVFSLNTFSRDLVSTFRLPEV